MEVIACGYCFNYWAVAYDHLVPRAIGGTNAKSNLYPTCKRCNSILGAKVFDSLEEKRGYVRTYLIAEGTWNPEMRELWKGLYEGPALAKILLPKVPMEEMGDRAPKKRSERECPVCGKRFIVTQSRQQYCSKNCERLLRAQDRLERNRRLHKLQKRYRSRFCNFFKCKRKFNPKTDNQRFHSYECRIRTFWIKREGSADAKEQWAWEAEIKQREAKSRKA